MFRVGESDCNRVDECLGIFALFRPVISVLLKHLL